MKAINNKCPRCGGYLLDDRGEVSCLNCGYRGATHRPAVQETVLLRHELKNLKHLKAIARGE